MAYTTIKKPSDYFNTNLYTGNNTETSHTVGFQPDFTWLKVRNADGSHYLFDSVRLATKYLQANSTVAEGTDANTLKSFDANGYTVGTSNSVNTNGETMVGWNWKAGTTSGITTDGNTTITPSSYSINQTAGFSILSYTGNGVEGAKLAHGLGTTPAMVIIKRYSTTGDWVVYHKNLSATKSVFLNYTDAETARSPNGYIYSPDATNITLSNHGDINNNGVTTVAYCFAEKQGFSKFGSYVGNGSATDGPFVYTGFKPAFVITKSFNVEAWQMTDSVRDKDVSPNFARLVPNLSNGENTNTTWAKVEKFSNGFKIGGNDTVSNESGTQFLYMAFAEEPLVGDNPATAR